MPLSASQLKEIVLSSNTDILQSKMPILLHNIQDKIGEKNMILTMNNLLQSTKTRHVGLQLVNELIVHFSLDGLLENVTFWCDNCVIHSNTQDNLKEIKLKITEKLVGRIGEKEQFRKKFVQEYLSDVVKTCLSYQCGGNNTEKVRLKCLSQCMSKYPSWFSNHQEKVETFLIKFLEEPSGNHIREAAVAFHIFNHTGSSGVDGIHYVNNFRNRFKKLCATVHVLYDSFLENIDEINDSEKIDSEVFTFNSIPPTANPQKFLEVEASRIVNCLSFMNAMIVKQYPVEKQIVPRHFVDVVSRGLSVHICFSDENALESQQSLLLSKIQLKLLQLLRVFTVWNPSCLLPFSHLITNAIFNTLKRTKSCSCFVKDSSYKISTYKTLKSWISLGKIVNHPQLQTTLIPLLLEDIRPVKKKIMLNSNSNKKTKLTQLSSFDHEDNVSARKVEIGGRNDVQEDVCIVALDVLNTFFMTYPFVINQVLQETVSFIVKMLAEIQMNKVVAPYTSSKCRTKLCEVLTSLVKHDHKVDLPIHMTTSILHEGLRCVDYQTSKTCREGLDVLETISYPVCASLHIKDHTPQSREQNHIISELHEKDVEYCHSNVENNFEPETDAHESLVKEDTLSVTTEKIKILSNVVISKSMELTDGPREPPNKKIKVDDALENMFASFQDVIK